MKSGYLYVLTHPSDPDLYKIGQTTRLPEQRLAEHNTNFDEAAGKIVQQTNQLWEIKTYIEVLDPYFAESAFWAATPLADIPFRGGVEVSRMEWSCVEAGLTAAKMAGVRPAPPTNLPDHVYAYTAWMRHQLVGRGMHLIGYVKSKSGKATFRCDNDHEWDERPHPVAEGAGCPQCDLGWCTPEEMIELTKPDYLCLLTHPDQPEHIKIAMSSRDVVQCLDEPANEGWHIHRHRNVEHKPGLAKKVIASLLYVAESELDGPIEMELSEAEEAIREFIYELRYRIALKEKDD